MFISVNTTLARRIGLYDAMVTSFLWDEVHDVADPSFLNEDNLWIRASAPALANRLPCLSVYQIRRVLRRLVERRILRREKRNPHPFDTTFSYKFTDVGIALMESCGEGYEERWL